MQNKVLHFLTGRNMQILLLGTLCMIGSFAIGIESAGEVKPFTLIQAGNMELEGDMNGNGALDMEDVTITLEIVQGYTEVTPELLLADPNGDGKITVDDALWILHVLSLNEIR